MNSILTGFIFGLSVASALVSTQNARADEYYEKLSAQIRFDSRFNKALGGWLERASDVLVTKVNKDKILTIYLKLDGVEQRRLARELSDNAEQFVSEFADSRHRISMDPPERLVQSELQILSRYAPGMNAEFLVNPGYQEATLGIRRR
jgi:hypothetical protein